MHKDLETLYREKIVPSMIKDFGYKNIEEVPKVVKISVNRGLGEASKNSKAEQPPNVIIIYTDDQGYGDLSSYGSISMKTPNIDALGSGGATFYDFLVGSSTCSPSRAALLTGAYPIRAGVVGVLWPKEGGGFGGKNKGLVGLHPNEVTIAESLKGSGYDTAMAGKWHLGSQAPFMPTDQGFDSYLGIPYSNNMNV